MNKNPNVTDFFDPFNDDDNEEPDNHFSTAHKVILAIWAASLISLVAIAYFGGLKVIW